MEAVPEGETWGRGPPDFQEAFTRASERLDTSRDAELLGLLGEDAKMGQEVRTQWYNFARGRGANADQARWDNRNQYSSELLGGGFLADLRKEKTWSPPGPFFEMRARKAKAEPKDEGEKGGTPKAGGDRKDEDGGEMPAGKMTRQERAQRDA